MNSKITATLVTLLLLMTTAAMIIPGPGTYAEEAETSSITVVDGMGDEVTFDGPVNKIMTIGKGPTSTTIGLGCLDKIVVADRYSATDSDPVFTDFKAKVEAGDILAHGTMYSSGANDLRTDMAQGVDMGFDKDKDAVVITATSNADLIQSIRDLGFKNILWWSSITEYDEIIDYVSVMSRVLLGSDAPEVESMRYVHNYVLTKVGELDARQDALYVRMDKGTLKVGNYGSLANSMLVEAGADVITLDKENPNSIYQTGIPALFDEHPDAMVFADDNICKSAENRSQLEAQLPDGREYFRIDPLWNNYSIKSADGLWAIACHLYPDMFSGEVPDVPETIKVVDGDGTEFTFYGPVDRIMTIGKGPTSTAISIGCLDKIVVADKYSSTDSDPVFTDFKAKVAAGDILAGGTVYSSGSNQLKADMAQGVDKGFDLLNDAVVITSSINGELLQSIRDMGFKNILRWNSITEYGQLIDYVSVMSKVLTGKDSPEVESMIYVHDYVKDRLGTVADRQDAFYVNIQKGNLVVGNYGSLANSLVMEAGGNVITLDDKNPNSTYQTAVANLFDEHPKSIVFADDSICKNADNRAKLDAQLPPGTKVVRMDPLWNNYSIKSADGLWEIACSLYPSVFSGEMPTPSDPEPPAPPAPPAPPTPPAPPEPPTPSEPSEPESGDGGSDNSGLILIGSIIGVLALAAVVVYVMKR